MIESNVLLGLASGKNQAQTGALRVLQSELSSSKFKSIRQCLTSGVVFPDCPEALSKILAVSPEFTELFTVVESCDFRDSLCRKALFAASFVVSLTVNTPSYRSISRRCHALFPRAFNSLTESHLPLVFSASRFLSAVSFTSKHNSTHVARLLVKAAPVIAKHFQIVSSESQLKKRLKEKSDPGYRTALIDLVLGTLYPEGIFSTMNARTLVINSGLISLITKYTDFSVQNEYVLVLKAVSDCLFIIPKSIIEEQMDLNNCAQILIKSVLNWILQHCHVDSVCDDVSNLFLSLCSEPVNYSKSILFLILNSIKINMDDESKLKRLLSLLQNLLKIIPLNSEILSLIFSNLPDLVPKKSEKSQISNHIFSTIVKSILIESRDIPWNFELSLPVSSISTLKSAINSFPVQTLELLVSILSLYRKLTKSKCTVLNLNFVHSLFPDVKSVFGSRLTLLSSSETRIIYLKFWNLFSELFPDVVEAANIPIKNLIDCVDIQSFSVEERRLFIRLLSFFLSRHWIELKSFLTLDNQLLSSIIFDCPESRLLIMILLSHGNSNTYSFNLTLADILITFFDPFFILNLTLSLAQINDSDFRLYLANLFDLSTSFLDFPECGISIAAIMTDFLSKTAKFTGDLVLLRGILYVIGQILFPNFINSVSHLPLISNIFSHLDFYSSEKSCVSLPSAQKRTSSYLDDVTFELSSNSKPSLQDVLNHLEAFSCADSINNSVLISKVIKLANLIPNSVLVPYFFMLVQNSNQVFDSLTFSIEQSFSIFSRDVFGGMSVGPIFSQFFEFILVRINNGHQPIKEVFNFIIANLNLVESTDFSRLLMAISTQISSDFSFVDVVDLFLPSINLILNQKQKLSLVTTLTSLLHGCFDEKLLKCCQSIMIDLDYSTLMSFLSTSSSFDIQLLSRIVINHGLFSKPLPRIDDVAQLPEYLGVIFDNSNNEFNCICALDQVVFDLSQSNLSIPDVFDPYFFCRIVEIVTKLSNLNFISKIFTILDSLVVSKATAFSLSEVMESQLHSENLHQIFSNDTSKSSFIKLLMKLHSFTSNCFIKNPINYSTGTLSFENRCLFYLQFNKLSGTLDALRQLPAESVKFCAEILENFETVDHEEAPATKLKILDSPANWLMDLLTVFPPNLITNSINSPINLIDFDLFPPNHKLSFRSDYADPQLFLFSILICLTSLISSRKGETSFQNAVPLATVLLKSKALSLILKLLSSQDAFLRTCCFAVVAIVYSTLEHSTDETVNTLVLPSITSLKNSVSTPGSWLSPLITESIVHVLSFIYSSNIVICQSIAKFISKTTFFSSNNPLLVSFLLTNNSTKVTTIRTACNAALTVAQCCLLSKHDLELFLNLDLVNVATVELVSTINGSNKILEQAFSLLLVFLQEYTLLAIEDWSLLALFESTSQYFTQQHAERLFSVLIDVCSKLDAQFNATTLLILASTVTGIIRINPSLISGTLFKLFSVILSLTSESTSFSSFLARFVLILEQISWEVAPIFLPHIISCLDPIQDLSMIPLHLLSINLFKASLNSHVESYNFSFIKFWNQCSNVLDSCDLASGLLKLLPDSVLRRRITDHLDASHKNGLVAKIMEHLNC
ncbi:hypothetical protein RCL1_003305 [Eukaryota sp. TZLM3-RCL]